MVWFFTIPLAPPCLIRCCAAVAAGQVLHQPSSVGSRAVTLGRCELSLAPLLLDGSTFPSLFATVPLRPAWPVAETSEAVTSALEVSISLIDFSHVHGAAQSGIARPFESMQQLHHVLTAPHLPTAVEAAPTSLVAALAPASAVRPLPAAPPVPASSVGNTQHSGTAAADKAAASVAPKSEAPARALVPGAVTPSTSTSAAPVRAALTAAKLPPPAAPTAPVVSFTAGPKLALHVVVDSIMRLVVPPSDGDEAAAGVADTYVVFWVERKPTAVHLDDLPLFAAVPHRSPLVQRADSLSLNEHAAFPLFYMQPSQLSQMLEAQLVIQVRPINTCSSPALCVCCVLCVLTPDTMTPIAAGVAPSNGLGAATERRCGARHGARGAGTPGPPLSRARRVVQCRQC